MAAGTLFFTSPIGLGHASRDAAIAEHLDDIRFVTGGPAAAMLSGYGHPVEDAYRPPSFEVRAGRLRNAALWMARYYLYYRRCRGIAAAMIRRHRPALVVSDEDFAALTAARDLDIPAVAVTDILETRFLSGVISARVERRMNGAMTRLLAYCRTVIIPETGPDERNIRRVGPIVRETARSRAQLRTIHRMRRKTVLVTAGGTDAGAFLLEEMSRVASKISTQADTVVVPGPSLGGNLVLNLHEMICAADVVVSLAGRSTIDEAAAYGTPGVFVPISGHFEQEDNARRAGYSPGDEHRLYELVLTKLDSPRTPAGPGGARRAADLISAAREGL